MRMDAKDLEKYITDSKSLTSPVPIAEPHRNEGKGTPTLVISGQDMVLDILGQYIEKDSGHKTLRSNTGSLSGLISMYNGDSDIVSMHMFDGDTGEYNLPYIKRSWLAILIFYLISFQGMQVYMLKKGILSISPPE